MGRNIQHTRARVRKIRRLPMLPLEINRPRDLVPKCHITLRTLKRKGKGSWNSILWSSQAWKTKKIWEDPWHWKWTPLRKIHKTPFKNLIDGDFQLRGSIISWGLSNFPGCRSRQGALAVAMGSLGAFEMGLGSQWSSMGWTRVELTGWI